MGETSGSGVLSMKTICHREAVQPFLQDCASRLRFPLGACFDDYEMLKLDFFNLPPYFPNTCLAMFTVAIASLP